MESLDKNEASSVQLLDACCQLLAKKISDKPIDEWRAADYNRLNSQLGKQTKIYLSENTLKRIFGRLKTHKRYYPQKATRDALAQFVGYRDWQEFELITLAEIKRETVQKELPTNVQPIVYQKNKKFSPQNIFYVGIALLILIASVFLYVKKLKTPVGVKLICENPYGNIPHTAFFKLKDSSGNFANYDFDIDFFGEASNTKIKAGQKFTRFFKNPMVIYANLLYHKKPIDTTPIIIQTGGHWVATSKNDSTRLFSINNLKPLNSDNIYVSSKQLDSAGVNLSRRFQVDYSNIKKSTINGDNFSFTCGIVAEQTRPGVQCIETVLIIYGEKDFHYIKLYRQNCVAFSEYKFSETHVLGSDEFLGNLAFNPENGGNIELKVYQKRINLFINNKLALQTSYAHTIGKIMGIKIILGGIGKIIVPKLIDLQSGELF